MKYYKQKNKMLLIKLKNIRKFLIVKFNKMKNLNKQKINCNNKLMNKMKKFIL